MEIRAYERIPLLEQPQHGLHFRGVRFHVVAIEVQILRGGAPAGFLGPILIGAIPTTRALMAVRIEGRHK